MRDRKIKAIRVEDATPWYIPSTNRQETSRFLVNKDNFGAEAFSFHYTTFEPNFEAISRGDGVHEYVQFTFKGSSTRILKDGTVIECTPGTVVYLPPDHDEYRHVIGPEGLTLILAVSPGYLLNIGLRELEPAYGGYGGLPEDTRPTKGR